MSFSQLVERSRARGEDLVESSSNGVSCARARKPERGKEGASVETEWEAGEEGRRTESIGVRAQLGVLEDAHANGSSVRSGEDELADRQRKVGPPADRDLAVVLR